MAKDVNSDYPNRGKGFANAAPTALPDGFVGLLVYDDVAESYAVIHFSPRRARKLARQIVKAAKRVEGGGA